MDYLAQLRAQRARELAGARFPAQERAQARAFVQIVRPVSKRAAKSQIGRQLKVRNWQINAKHFN